MVANDSPATGDSRSKASRPIPFGNASENCPIGEDRTISQEVVLRFNDHAGRGPVELCRNRKNRPFVNELMRFGNRAGGRTVEAWRIGSRPRLTSQLNGHSPRKKKSAPAAVTAATAEYL